MYNLEVGQWHNFLVGCSGVVAHNSYFDNLIQGKKIGSGGEKVVYEITNQPDKVLGILKDGVAVSKIDDEIALLKSISDEGLPVVTVFEKGVHNGKNAVIYERFALGSKDVVRTNNGIVEIVGNSKLLNQTSINDLTLIKNMMIY